MDAPGQVAQGAMHGTVALDPAQRGQRGGADHDPEMAFARPVIAGMPGMAMAFVDDFQPCGLKGGSQPRGDLIGHRHFATSPFNPPQEVLNSCLRVGKATETTMTTRAPFEFDLRVSADKKRRKTGRRGMSGAFETSQKHCEYPGCSESGAYRAPKSPDHLDEFFWFCKDHVREYNLKWNFFQGTTDEEFQKFIDKDRVWGRETKPFGKKADEGRAWQRLGIEDPMAILGDKATLSPARPTSTATRKLPATERKALEILDARDSWTRTEIRKQYKSLVKDLHPDMNGGDRKDEERLQEVVWAWDQIKDSRYFRD